MRNPLQSILHEMVILESALLLRDKRYSFEKYPKLQWGPAQIAHDVIRLKSRLLLDFFYSTKPGLDDIVVNDFDIPVFSTKLVSRASPALAQFRKDRVNKWTIHLSWLRTEDPEYTKSERQLMEECALELLDIGRQFIDECVASGLRLDRWAEPLNENFVRLHEYLRRTQRVDEDRATVPPEQICLERL
jgi:hypothetical protein